VYPTLPIFAMGLSMGGMTIYNLALKDKTLFKGVILMAPSLRGILPDALGKIFCKISSIMPNSTKVLPPFYGLMSKNPQVVEDLKNDELTHKGGLPLKSLNVLIDAKYNSALTFKDFDVPFVVIQGGLDKLVNPKGAFELY
jgi:acylglycerol lipase